MTPLYPNWKSAKKKISKENIKFNKVAFKDIKIDAEEGFIAVSLNKKDLNELCYILNELNNHGWDGVRVRSIVNNKFSDIHISIKKNTKKKSTNKNKELA